MFEYNFIFNFLEQLALQTEVNSECIGGLFSLVNKFSSGPLITTPGSRAARAGMESK